MATKKDSIVVRFLGDDSGFQRVAKRVGSTTAKLTQTIGRFGNAIAGAFGVGAGVAGGGLVFQVARLTQELDALGKTAKGLNTTVEGLSALQYAVERTSTITGDQFSSTLQRLVKHIGQANRGVKESAKIFEELGLSWEYLASLNSDEAFIEVAEALAQMEDEYKRASLTQKIFEDRWRELLPVILEGKDGIKALTDEAREMGVPTDEAAAAAARLNDQMTVMNRQMEGLGYKYGPPVIEFFGYWIQSLTGVSGLNNALDKTIDQIARLDMELSALQGHGTWWDDFWTSFLTAEEKAGAIKGLTDRISELQKKADDLYTDQQKRESQTRQGTAGATTTGTSTGKKGSAKDPELTYHEANMRDFQAYRNGDITRQEWLSRERERNPYSNPDSPYAKDFNSGAVSYGSVDSTLGLSPNVSSGFQQEIELAVAAAMEGRTYRMKVVPELVGMEGVEVASRDTADKEGVHR